MNGSGVQVTMALSTLWVAIVLGVITGVGISVPVFLSARLLHSEHPERAVYGAMGGVFGGMLLAVALMFVYWYVAPEGFMYYGIASVVGFVVCMVWRGLALVRTGVRRAGDGDVAWKH